MRRYSVPVQTLDCLNKHEDILRCFLKARVTCIVYTFWGEVPLLKERWDELVPSSGDAANHDILSNNLKAVSNASTGLSSLFIFVQNQKQAKQHKRALLISLHKLTLEHFVS